MDQLDPQQLPKSTGPATPPKAQHGFSWAETLAALVDRSLDPLFWRPERLGSPPESWWQHVPFAHWAVCATAPRIFVELGTHTGVSYAAFCEAVERAGLATRCHAVDTWRGDPQAGFYGPEILDELRAFHDERFGAFSTLLQCTFDEALDRVDDGSIDLLHIDGLHTYEAVRHDFESWLPKLSDRAVVLFHDINVRRDDFGVWRLWAELREQYPAFDFVHGNGLGVLAVGRDTPGPIAALCALTDPAAIAMIRTRFARLGEHWWVDTRHRILAHGFWQRTAAAQVQTEQLRAEVAQHGSEAEALRAEVGHYSDEIETLRTELGQRGAEAEQLRAEVTRHACEAEAARKAAERTARQLRTASATTSVAEREAMQLRKRAAEVDRLLADAQAEQSRLRRELDDVLRSTFWRITAPVRRAASVLPPGLRRQGRRGARVAYWVLTPHRTRERIAYFRARREWLRPPPPVTVDPPPVIPHGNSGSLDNMRNSRETTLVEPTPDLISHRSARSETELLPISVVIPTHNRADLLEKTLRSCIDNSGMAETELIVIDDGSRDHTSDVLRRLETEIHNLTWRSIPNGGPGQARNLGATIASHPILLFLGDDIQPADDQFFAVHARLHSLDTSERIAVLGKVVWPASNIQDTNFVMSHIQGRGGEQFAYANLTPHTFVDWRFFYTSNISVKRSLVANWNDEGFRPEFTSAAFEDGEFAYRMQTQPNPLTIYYDPTSAGYHLHPYDLDGFIRRQENCGKMAKVFIGLHPEVSEILQLAPLVRELRKPLENGHEYLIADYATVVEGIKSWARLLEQTHNLGREWWHDDLLSAVFELSYLHGFMVSYADESFNLAAGYNHIIERCIQTLRVIIDRELTSSPQLQSHLGLLSGAE